MQNSLLASLLEKRSTVRWGIVFLLFLGVLINYVDRGNLSIAAVPLMRDFHRTPAAMGTLLSAFFWSYALLQIPAGYLVDRVGLKWSYGSAFLVWSLASASMGMAGTFAELYGLRVVLGIAESVAAPASLAYIKRNFSEEEQGLPTGFFTSGMILGPAVGALIGGVLVGHFGWRVLFLLTGLGGCVWLIPWFRYAPREKPTRPEPEAKHVQFPLTWKEIVHLPLLWAITIGAFFYSYYWYFCLTWLPAYLVMARDLSFVKMGAYTAMPLVAMAIVSPICGHLADRLISWRLRALQVRKAFVCLGFMGGSSIVLVPGVKSPPAVLAVLVLSLGGIGLASGNFWALTETVSPHAVVGRVVGYQNTIANLAGILAPLLTGWMVTDTKNFTLSIWVAGGSLWIAAASYFFLVRHADLSFLSSRFADDAGLRPERQGEQRSFPAEQNLES
jgi:MFS transporter, ACS family, D-galactonate transporter